MIVELFSPEVRLFLEDIENLGFSLCLVGGITRDYFYNNKLGDDIDFEIRPGIGLAFTIESWPLHYKKLLDYFKKKKLPYVELPYLITRVHFDNSDFEFSSPRMEKDLPGNVSHHHFEAVLDPLLTYDLSFKRRDFTINAIGIELKMGPSHSEKIIDPFKGLDDLKKGVLKNITDDFFLDSVRFLRLIRFKIKFEAFKIDEDLLSKLNHFNLSGLSHYHFCEELFKSIPGEFLNGFSKLVVSYQLAVPEEFNVWTKYLFPKTLLSKEEILAFVFLKSESDAKIVSQFFRMPEKKLKDLKSFVDSYRKISSLTKKDFLEVISIPKEEALKKELFKDLKNLEEKKEWRLAEGLGLKTNELPISFIDWATISVSSSELNEIDPPMRSYYQYFIAVKKKFHD